MPHTELRQESVNRSDLCPGAPTAISQIGCLNVVLAVGHKERHGVKPIQNLRASFRAGKALQDLLEDEPRRDNCLTRFYRSYERLHFLQRRTRIASERERSDTGVNEQAHSRRRSDL